MEFDNLEFVAAAGKKTKLHQMNGGDHTRMFSASTFAFSSTDTGNHVTAPAAAKMHRNGSTDSRMFSALDDNARLTKRIKANHSQDYGRDFDVESLFKLVEDILLRANTCTPGIPDVTTQARLDALDDEDIQNGVIDKLKLLGNPINKISCEISCKCSGGSDAHVTTMALLDTLSSYSWDAKAVIALAAFAANYGEFGLVAQLYQKDPVAKSVALLKQLPCILESADTVKLTSVALSTLIMAMQNVTKCIVNFKVISSQFTDPNTPAMLAAPDHIPTAVYLTVRGVVTCATQIMAIGAGRGLTAEASVRELSRLEQEIKDIESLLLAQLDLFKERIAKEKLAKAYKRIVHVIETAHIAHSSSIDNTTILEALIFAEDGEEDHLPLFHCSTKEQVRIDSLRRKHVLLLISDLESSHEELSILKQMYREKSTGKKREYEVVWFPVDDGSAEWDDEQEDKFERVKASVPWHSVSRPARLQPAVIKYMKEVWHYNKKPLVVVLDPRGRVVNPNAIRMMCIWRNAGFPFTSEREVTLWEDVTWTFELLVEPSISEWIEDEKYICFYGGTDIDWIRKFTDKAVEVGGVAEIKLEMLYLGKRNAREMVRKNNAEISKEHRGKTLSEENLNRFWVTLEGMWHSKMRHCKSIEDDDIMTEITTMLSLDANDEGWAVICDGSAKMAKAKGGAILSCLTNFDDWKAVARQDGFVSALNQNLQELLQHTTRHCNRLILAGTTGRIPRPVECPDCKDPMEKFIMYRCCKDYADDFKRAN